MIVNILHLNYEIEEIKVKRMLKKCSKALLNDNNEGLINEQ